MLTPGVPGLIPATCGNEFATWSLSWGDVLNHIIVFGINALLTEPLMKSLVDSSRQSMCARDVAKGYEGVKPSTERVGGWVSTDVKLHE